MSRTLILVSLLCLAACVSATAPNGYVVLTSYTDSACSAGKTAVSNTGYTFGSCLSSTSNSAQYIVTDSTTGNAVIAEVGFVDAGTCNTAYYSQQSFSFQLPTFASVTFNACTASGALYQQYTLVNAGSPAVPAFTATGNGAISAVSYFNPTTFQANTVCPIPSTAITLPQSGVTGVCTPGDITGTSQLGFCLGGGQFSGTAYYNVLYTAATACSATSFQYASLQETTPNEVSCYQGQPGLCFGGSAPSYIPNQGSIRYSPNDPCTGADGLAQVYLFPQSTCFSTDGTTGAQFTCGTNSTSGASQVTYAQYSSSTCLSNTQTSVTVGLASTSGGSTAAAATNLVGVGCRSTGPNSNNAITCNFWSAAPSVSVSVVALLFAAILSLVAAKNL